MAPATESIMGSLPREKAGVGSAMNDTTRQMGGALGVAVLGSVFATVYRPGMADQISGARAHPRAGQPGPGLDRRRAPRRRRAARRTAAQLVDIAKHQFVDGMHLALSRRATVRAGRRGDRVQVPPRPGATTPASCRRARSTGSPRSPSPRPRATWRPPTTTAATVPARCLPRGRALAMSRARPTPPTCGAGGAAARPPTARSSTPPSSSLRGGGLRGASRCRPSSSALGRVVGHAVPALEQPRPSWCRRPLSTFIAPEPTALDRHRLARRRREGVRRGGCARHRQPAGGRAGRASNASKEDEQLRGLLREKFLAPRLATVHALLRRASAARSRRSRPTTSPSA